MILSGGRRLVSVVVIGRNEGDRLRRCLESVTRMDRENFDMELIYVDSGSTDDSLALASRLGARTVALQPTRPCAALGRNAGWHIAKGSLVLFLDGDTVLDRRFVEESLADFETAETAVVWGHRREMHPTRSIYNRALDLDWVYAPGRTPFCGGDALFRTDVLRITGGFDETLIAGEEPELCRRITALGFHVLHVDRAMTGHDLAMTEWSQYWRRARRAGHAYAEVSERFSTSVDPFWTSEVRHTRNRAIALQALAAIGFFGSVIWWVPEPLLFVIAMFVLLAVRSAWKARWKSKDWYTLLVYGFHSHLQQIPIFWGQRKYRSNRRQGKQAMLLEYKKQ
ncbi:Glycosyl transferase family 2 [Granulicella rosea]|uniref:Glycosyl transferase family 2 n=1 Tax=Granulicella rosea TaxID=474952 RepID=A0A239ETB0_9BACT|nr:glycosyltransferase family A protein [Granulicella rosea]SNS47895.1 Glycosyl transferase family 2 [Granulicella rosea]